MQTPTKPFWTATNLTVLLIQALILSLGIFYRHISFGWGLGDLFWYGFIIISLLTHFILTLAFKKKLNRIRTLTIIFLTITIFVCLKATVWRGDEYRWNGKIFYESNEKVEFVPFDSLKNN